MTDNEIKKALEKWCDNNCKKVCPHLKICDKCVVTYIKSALNLINRQKAEIERLTKANERFAEEFDSYYASVKSQAIKEFAKRLKEKAYLVGAVSITQELVVDVRDIDTLVEEMTVNYESSKNDKQRKEDEGK